MRSAVKLAVLTTVTLVMMMVAPLFAHKDDACMECPCGRCYGSISACCLWFNASPLTRLKVSVNCSHPEQSSIIDPGNLAYKFVQNSTTCSGFNLVHENSCLTAMPDNYCKYVATRAVDLSGNNLTAFPDLKCLFLLGRLSLVRNKLTSVSRDAFKGLKQIREIYLDHNEISYIDPLAFDEDLTELSIFSYNRLVTVEAWPFSLHHMFCVFNFSHNQLQHFANRGHWKFNTSKAVIYGPGMVDFSYNRFVDGPMDEMSQFGIKSVLQLAKFMRWGFDFRHNPFRCDCHIYAELKWGKVLAKFIWRDYFNVTCGSPPQFHGLPALQLSLEQLVCNVTADCPPGCYCEHQPAKKAMFVFCDDVGLRSLPAALPEGNHLVIHMANNSLDSLPPRQYLTRTKMMDLRGSGLKEVEKDTPHLLKKAKLVDLRDNELRHLPSTFQALEREVVRLDLHTLTCSCDLVWMSTWLQHSNSNDLENITCTKDDGKMIPLINANKHVLCEKKTAPYHITYYKIFLIAVLSLLALVTSLMLLFRHEVLVVTQSYRARRAQRRKKKLSPGLLNPQQYDVFISMNVNSDSDTQWVKNVLLPKLELRDLQAYHPQRDCPVGTVEMDELTKRMQDSATTLVVLSPDYVQNLSCLFQFKQAYEHMIALRQGNLLVVKRAGPLSRRSVQECRLRAMLTLRMFCSAEGGHLSAVLDTLVVNEETEM